MSDDIDKRTKDGAKKKKPGVLIRVPAELADDIKGYLVYYRSIKKLKGNVTKQLEIFRVKNDMLHINSTMSLDFTSTK